MSKGPEQPGAWHKSPHWIRPPLARVSWDAAAMWWAISSWCAASSASGADRGWLPWDDLHVAVDRKITEARCSKLVGELARPGVELVTLDDDRGVYLGDWWVAENPGPEVWNDPVERERWARARRLKRDTELCNRIKTRDRNLCRYCGIRVNWNDKVSPKGGTYDHVDPDGGNEFSNVVVACRRCNGRKRNRTPEQWAEAEPTLQGLAMLRPGTTAEQAAAQRARAGPSPGPSSGQPPANPRPTAPPGSRARPDRVDPGPTAPPRHSGLTERALAPIGSNAFTSSCSGSSAPDLEIVPPPPTDADYPGGHS